MKDYVGPSIAYAIQNNDMDEIKKIWKKTKEYKAGIIYAKYLISLGDTTTAKKTLLDLRKYCGVSNGIYFELAVIETSLGNYDIAKNYLSKINGFQYYYVSNTLLGKIYRLEKNYSESRYTLEKQISNSKLKNSALVELVYLNIHEKKYAEAFRILSSLKYYFKDTKDHEMAYGKMMLFLGKKLNVVPNIDNYPMTLRSYISRQLISYSKKEAIDHIYRHKEGAPILHHPVYNKDADIDMLFEQAKEFLNEDTYVSTNAVDLYNLYCPGVGNNGEDYLLVITIPNSKAILNMYPIHGREQISTEELVKKRQ